MKILAIAATPFFSDRGAHMRIYNEAKYLQKLGAKVRLCTYHIGENIPEIDAVRIKGPACYKKISPGFSWGKIWLDLKMFFLVRREIRKYNPDIIHAHLYEGLAIGYLARKAAFKKIPIVFDLQGNIGEEFKSYNRKNSGARKFFVWMAKIVINWADKTVVSSENVKIWTSDVQIIKDGIDLDLFQNHPKVDPLLAEIEKIKEWAGDSQLLVYIGGLSDNKGVGGLLETFSRLNLKNSNWKLLLGGFGEDEEKYKKYIAENDLEKSVYFAGKVRYFSLPRYLSLANAGIDPKSGSAESSGKLANLMAAGLPVVCFENDFNRARLGDKGFYLKTFDDLQAILESMTSAEKINYDLENLSEEKEARKLFGIFEQLTK
ncbi:MAG: glycosyltransferase family 4 protein [Candidatus Moranbacteria bacterium]|nr:glycosyltransferase family 4 protein [Candidatus Moranbacteria bacterium]